MKQRDVLTGIGVRAAGVKPYKPSSFALSQSEQEPDTFNVILQKLYEEFPFLYSGGENVDQSELERYEGLFSWLVEQVGAFPCDVTDPDRCLTNILALATLLECNDQLWDELAQAVPNIPKPLILSLAKRIKESGANGQRLLAGRYFRSSPKQTQEFISDIETKNWKSIEWVIDSLCMETWSPAKQHASAALYRFDCPRLRSILEGESDFFEIAAYVLHAPATQSLQLALTSTNWTFKFWALYHSLKCFAKDSESHSMEWASILSEAAKIPDEWERWLAVFNAYPSRYPQLQETLGSVLASAPISAIDIYVASISAISDYGRVEIATALTVFREKAPVFNRQRLWTAAFKRWKEWNFGCTEHQQSLFRVTKSSFDFPVIGYITECLDSQARIGWAAKLEARAAAIERDWHSDVTSTMSERYKLISTYQLIAHSETVASGNPEWLWEPPLHKPIWEDGSLYRTLKYDSSVSGSATVFSS